MRSHTLAITVALALAAGCSSENDTASTASVAPTVTASDGTTAETSPTTPPKSTTAESTTPEVTVPLIAGSVVLTPYLNGFRGPVDLVWRDGDPALYVVDQPGVITRVVDGVSGPAVLDISDLVSCCAEQGLLGLAFHPTESLAYVDYTNTDGDTVIAEFAVGAEGMFDDASRRTVMTISQPYENHNGGKIAFGPDGVLYIGMGDGGSGGDPERRAMDLGEPLGKLLRIDPRANGDQPYTVPADNPFVDVDGALPEIWSIGLRNPWRFNFDSATGDLWIGDVGQGDWEEVNVAHASDGGGRGFNFGWSAFEGTHPYNSDQPTDGVTPPIYEYAHDGDDGCSISGGTVYRGDAIPSLRGWYLFGDYCSGKVWALSEVPDAAPIVLELTNAGSVSAIAAGPNGELYVLAYNSGSVLRIDPA